MNQLHKYCHCCKIDSCLCGKDNNGNCNFTKPVFMSLMMFTKTKTAKYNYELGKSQFKIN